MSHDRPMPARPADDAPFAEKCHWLALTYGYCALTDTVVELYEPSDECQLKPAAFQRSFRAWREVNLGPRGGQHVQPATGVWDINPDRPNIRGVRLRPDRPFPTYSENGALYKNSYRKPRHEGTGDIQPWLDFMTHLLPAEAEREWFCDWLAFKHRHPGTPGIAVVMVAANGDGPVYGAGRGILRDILARLLGPKYVKPIDFDIFTGRSAQAVYTDWAAYAVLVTVNEAKDTPESGRWSERRAVYERLKELVDPRAIERTFLKKGQQAFQAPAFASYLIASNNRDALQIPPGDRRVAALANGGQLPGAQAKVLQAWMEQPGNIAALAGFLERRDLSGFDAYTPLRTATKAVMQELARSELDDGFAAARKLLGRGALFTGELLQAAVTNEISDPGRGDEFQRWIKRRIRSEATQVEDFRMPRVHGFGPRHKILRWRDYDGPPITDLAAAQGAVEFTKKRLSKADTEESAWPPKPAGGASVHKMSPRSETPGEEAP